MDYEVISFVLYCTGMRNVSLILVLAVRKISKLSRLIPFVVHLHTVEFNLF